jgi:6-pyruvoyltetrahydropterin/6-carboxytetrahydropterin synthase
MTTATRYHDFSAGHRVVGHEGKCAHLHGHNYRVHFTVAPLDKLDQVGRVLDFSVIKTELCMFLEDVWDHKMMLWDQDPDIELLRAIDPNGIAVVPFNPTAENMAIHLVTVVGPRLLAKHNVELVRCTVEETAKCSATHELELE